MIQILRLRMTCHWHDCFLDLSQCRPLSRILSGSTTVAQRQFRPKILLQKSNLISTLFNTANSALSAIFSSSQKMNPKQPRYTAHERLLFSSPFDPHSTQLVDFSILYLIIIKVTISIKPRLSTTRLFGPFHSYTHHTSQWMKNRVEDPLSRAPLAWVMWADWLTVCWREKEKKATADK